MNYNTFFSGQEGELATFVCRFLEEKGAIAEAGKNRVDLLLPGDLARTLEAQGFRKEAGQSWRQVMRLSSEGELGEEAANQLREFSLKGNTRSY